ncbi:MAG TPA: histidine phosphatase family protein [Aggregatilineaceae bacterium]|nr:histidine phosphatase family protein [Aggregatilineaceae bacterium]
MAFLYLIRHPKTQPDSALPASQWRLSDDGQKQVRDLVAAAFWDGVAAVYTSQEHKTTVVGEAVLAAHGVTHIAVQELGEAKRDQWVSGDQFYAAQASFFSRPDVAPIPSWESAAEARERFVQAMDSLLSRHPRNQSLAVVSHATVLTLYVAHLFREAPSFQQWQKLGFAEVMAVDRAALHPITPFLAAPYDGLPYSP